MRGLLLTITVITNSCTKETLCSPGVGCVRASLDYGARDTLDCTLVINTICALRMRATAIGVGWVSDVACLVFLIDVLAMNRP